MATSELGAAFDPTDCHDQDDADADQYMSVRRFLDPVHDYVLLEPRVAAFVDTKQFQRLRYLKQLGTAYYIFPGGSHNRFEHCLGVAHLARLMVDSLRTRQPKLGIDNRDVFCVQVAGLMHDLGHGPFSHVFDNQFLTRVRPDRNWCHEEGSEMMFDALISSNPQIEITQGEVDFIKDLIRGKPRISKGEKSFLFQIVANAENGLDVDKLDYIARDALNCGVKHGVTTTRFISTCRVVDGHIVYPYKDLFNVFQVYHTRYALHKQVYNHKTGKAIEHMVVDALVAADPVLKMSQMIEDPQQYLHLTDSILEEIERSTDPALEASRRIIDRLRRRDLYRIVDHKLVPCEYRDKWKADLSIEKIVEEAKLLNGDPYAEVTCEDVIVDWSTLHLGMKDKDPMQLVRFYSKHNPDKSFVARRDEGSYLLPEVTQETQMSIFARDPSKRHLIQKAYRALLEKLPEHSDSEHSTPPPQTHTLPVAAALGPTTSFESTTTTVPSPPSTPKVQSNKLRGSLRPSPSGSDWSPGSNRGHGSAKEPNQFMTFPTPAHHGSAGAGAGAANLKRLRESQNDKQAREGSMDVDRADGSPGQPPRNRRRVE